MNATAFVGISSLFLIAWLGFAFIRDVPSQRYQPEPCAGNPPPQDQTMLQRLAGAEDAPE